MYTFLMLVRFYPFWAIPVALMFFEVGMYFFHQRKRYGAVFGFGTSFILIALAILWIVYEGYWRAGPFMKESIEHIFG